MDNNEGVEEPRKRSKEEDYFTNLPSEIIIDILSRLPIRTIIACKIVCKSWCNVVTSLEFAKSHLSRSRPGLAVSQLLGKGDPPHLRFFEFIDETDPYFDRINFKFPHDVEIRSSVDGLLALGDSGGRCHYICNPITREYIKLPCPPSPPGIHMIGLGVSKISGQYKLVRIALPFITCEVYTLGTGSWRSIAAGYRALEYYRMYDEFVFLKGVLHSLVSSNRNNHLEILCFDLETELFSTLALPSQHSSNLTGASLVTLRDCLCFYHYSFDFGEINIWSMKEHGDDRLWTKELVIKDIIRNIPLSTIDLRVFIDGDILMVNKHGPELVRLSPKTNTIRGTRLSGVAAIYMVVRTIKVVYTPSFLPVLKTLVMEDVTSF